ncbi:MAG: PKD domain-containing protein [Bacteroidetes bacterium]|nr:PKD domain-containing protein [Bacteroidota bacterium]
MTNSFANVLTTKQSNTSERKSLFFKETKLGTLLSKIRLLILPAILFSLLTMDAGVSAQVPTLIKVGTGTGNPASDTDPGVTVEAASPYGLTGAVASGKKVQMIYTKTMIESAMTTAGFTPSAAFIHDWAFNVTSAVGGGMKAVNYTVKMANVAQADISGGYYTGTMTTVYTLPSLLMDATGWITSPTFATPFTWDGSSNLCIEVCYSDNNTTGSYSNWGAAAYTDFPGSNHMGMMVSGSACATPFPGTNIKTTRLTNIQMNITSAASCTGAPALTTASGATPCAGTSAPLSLSGVLVGSSYTYQWLQSNAPNGTYTNATGGTSTNNTFNTPTTLPYPTTYYKCDVTCPSSGQTTRSNEGTVNNADFLTCYCTGNYASGNNTDMGITKVAIGAPASPIISNTSTVIDAGIFGGPCYSLYTAPTPVSNAGLVALGNYNLAVTVIGVDNNNLGTPLNYVRAWIDYDQNGVFDASESIGTFGPVLPSTANINFTVPSNAPSGTTAMRIRHLFGAAVGTGDACTNLTAGWSRGETEDYRVAITGGCTGPNISATSFNSNNVLPTAADISFTRGNGTNVIVLAHAGGAVNANPVSANGYTANAAFGSGSQIGTGNFVVYNGNAAGVSITNLTNSTQYYFAVYEYLGSGASACYKLDNILTGNFTTPLCVQPSNPPTGVSASPINMSSATINWTEGDGASFVLMKQGSAVSSDPAQVTGYTANAAFGSGDQIGTGNYVVKASTGGSVNVTGLLPSTTYHYKVYTFKSASNCYLPTGVTGNFTTSGCYPTVQASSIAYTCTDYSKMTFTFNRGNGTHAIVLAKAGSDVDDVPVYNTSYTANLAFGTGSQIGTGNFVVYNGNNAGTVSVPVTGLTSGITYYYKVFEYNASPNCYNYNSPLTNIQATRNAATYTSSTVAQIATDVRQNSLAQPVVQLQVVVGGGVDPAAILNSITFNTSGSTNTATDITKAKIYYTGTSSTFSSATQFGSTFTSFAGNLTATGNVALLSGTNYFWVAYDLNLNATLANVLDAAVTKINITDNSGTNDKTPSVTAPAGSRLIVVPSLSYCSATHASTVATYGAGGVSSVSFGANSYTGNCCAGPKYIDATSTIFPLTKGSTYTLTVNTYQNGYAFNMAVWVDWNNNGDFADAGEQMVANTAFTSDIITTSFMVPLGATDGTHTIRVRSNHNIGYSISSPCGSVPTLLGAGGDGQTVDLTIDLGNGSVGVQAVSCATVAPTVSTPVNYMKGDVATALTATGSSLSWYTASYGGTGSGTAPTPSTAASGTLYYYVSQTVSGCEGPRAQIAVVTGQAACVAPCSSTPAQATVSTIKSTFCGSGTAILSLIGLGSDTYEYAWESAPDVSGTPGIWGPASGTITSATYNTGTVSASTWFRCKVSCTALLATTTSLTLKITINPLPSISVNPAAPTVCRGASEVLTASGADTYTWSPGTGLSGTSGASVTATRNTTQTYTVTGTDVNNCSSTQTVTVTVNNNVVTMTPNGAFIVPGDNVNLNASFPSANGYTWSPGTGLNTTNGATVNASPATTTTYTVTAEDNTGCFHTAQATVSVNLGTPASVSCGYAYSETTTPLWTAPTGGTALSMVDDAVYTNIPLNFNFDYNGIVYNSVGISTNGFLWFGSVNPSATEYNPISSSSVLEGVISPFGMNLTDATGAALSYQTTGVAGSRKFTVLWDNVRGIGGSVGSKMSFFVTLSEANHGISFQYTAGDVQAADLYTAQVGIRGASNTDFNNLSVPCSNAGQYGWDVATNGGANTNTSAAVLNFTCAASPSGFTTPQFYNAVLGGLFPYFNTQGVYNWIPKLTTPTISPTASQTICSHETLAFTSSTTNASPTYQWLRNGGNAAGASTSANYTAGPSLTAGSHYFSVKVISGGCYRISNVTKVTVNASPAVYNVTGGTQCGTALVGLSSSDDNTVSYQLVRNGVTNVGSPVAGSSAAFNFGSQATAGTYTVLASNALCPNIAMTGSSLVNPLPANPTSGGNVSVCADLAPGTISATSAGNEIDWYVASTGGTADKVNSTTYTSPTTITRYAQSRIAGTGCVSASRTSVVLTVNPMPVAYDVSGGACTPAIIGLTGSQFGVNYQLIRDGVTPVGSPIGGINAPVSFGYFNTTGTYSAVGTSAAGCSTPMIGVSLVNLCLSEWTGATSTDWFKNTNWAPPAVPNICGATIRIYSNAPRFPVIAGADVQVGNMEIAAGASITLQGQSLGVCGDWTVTAGTGVESVVSGDGLVTINGGFVQTISGKARFDLLQIDNSLGVVLASGAFVTVRGGVQLKIGDLNTTAGTLHLMSYSSIHCAYLDDFTPGFAGTLTGNIYMDRFIPTRGFNQHYMSSPVNAPTFKQLGGSGPNGIFVQPDVYCDETKSAYHSPYGTVFSYDDTYMAPGQCKLGNWQIKSQGTMDNGRGYSSYQQGDTVRSLIGPPNTGDLTVSGLNNKGSVAVPTLQSVLNPIESGWNLVGNPYPSVIDLTTPRAGFSNQVQVWMTSGVYSGSWQQYQIGISPHIYIAPFQAFMVLKTSAGNNGSFDFFQSERIRSYAGIPFFRTSIENSLVLEVDYNGVKDITTVEFNPEATEGFDAQFDASKPSGQAGRPTLFTHMNANRGYAINSLPSLHQATTVPMGLRPEANGMMKISAVGIQSFDPTSYIFLEDKQTGVWHNMRDGDYTFATKTTDNQDRFVLHFTPPAQILTSDATCSGSGMIQIEQPGSSNWNYSLSDVNGTVVSTGTLNASSPVNMSANAGVYSLTLRDNNGYTVMKNIQVSGEQSIVAAFAASSNLAKTQEEITFTSQNTGVVTTEWNFGDGNTASTIDASHRYTSEGVYTVSLTVINEAGCKSVTTQTVTITSREATGLTTIQSNKLPIWSADNRVFIDFGGQTKVEAEIELYNIIGQLISSEKFGRSTIYSKEIPNLEAAYMIVKVKNDGVTTTKRVFIGNVK